MVLVNDCAHFICRPSAHIINLSTTSGIVPDQPKITRGLPIFKSGDKSYLSKHRPVSVSVFVFLVFLIFFFFSVLSSL